MSFIKSFYLPDCFDPFNVNNGYQTYYKKSDLPVQVGQWVTFGSVVDGKPFYTGQLFLLDGYWRILPILSGESITQFSKRFSRLITKPLIIPLENQTLDSSDLYLVFSTGRDRYMWSRNLKKLAKKDPIQAMQELREIAHENGFTFHTPAKPVNKPTYPVRSFFQRNNVVSFSRPIKNRPPTFQVKAYALASRCALR